MVGDRVAGLFDDGDAPGMHVERVSLEPMKRRTYVLTRTRERDVRPYSKAELEQDGVAVDIDARFVGPGAGATYPVDLTLERRDENGDPVPVDTLPTEYWGISETLDFCGCHAWVKIPSRDGEYRVEVEIRKPDVTESASLAHKASDWLRP